MGSETNVKAIKTIVKAGSKKVESKEFKKGETALL